MFKTKKIVPNSPEEIRQHGISLWPVVSQIDPEVSKEEFLASEGKYSLKCPYAPLKHSNGQDSRPSSSIFFYNLDEPPNFYCWACKTNKTLVELCYDIGVLRQDPALIHAKETIENLEKQKNTLLFTHIKNEVRNHYAPQLPKEQFFLPQSLITKFPFATRSQKALEYLRSRQIDTETADLYELHFDPEKQRIVFPIFNQQKLVGAVGRDVTGTNPKPYYNYYHAPLSQFLGGSHLVTSDTKKIVLVEGFFDLLKFATLRLPTTVPLAVFTSSVSNAQLATLLRYDLTTYCAFDNDPPAPDGSPGAGELGWRKLVKKASGKIIPLIRLRWPQQYNDIGAIPFFQLKQLAQEYKL